MVSCGVCECPIHLSKAALTQTVKLLSASFAPHGIRVNGIAPDVYAIEYISNLYGDYERIISYGSIPRELISLTRTGGTENLVGLASLSGRNPNDSIMVSDGGSMNVMPLNYWGTHLG